MTIVAMRKAMPVRLLSCVAAACVFAGCGGDARHERAIGWSLGGKWLVADLHTHTRFSDGALQPDELVRRAVANGCQVLAITDHGDPGLKAAEPEYFEAIEALRAKLPQLVLFAGMEWNVPPFKGREHVTVLTLPTLERRILPEHKQRFDASRGAIDAAEALKWMAGAIKEPAGAVLFYNHPTRDMASSPERVQASLAAWRGQSPAMIGFEGAPGHQRAPRAGAYGLRYPADERWDVVAATVGGAWDRLLDAGHDVWGAIANSDYHNAEMDHEPCAFARTHLQVPEATQAGVLKALQAGSFWAGHGRVLKHLALTVHAAGLAVPASPGEVIRVDPVRETTVRVAIERDENARGAPLAAEIIGNCGSGRPDSIARIEFAATEDAVETTVRDLKPGADGVSCYVRARVRKPGEGGEALLAYTNPVRLRLR